MSSERPESSVLADNLTRLLGLHALSLNAASALLGLSPQGLSLLRQGKRKPSFATIARIEELFELPIRTLRTVPFAELLARELSDPERFARVEAKIRSGGEQAGGAASRIEEARR